MGARQIKRGKYPRAGKGTTLPRHGRLAPLAPAPPLAPGRRPPPAGGPGDRLLDPQQGLRPGAPGAHRDGGGHRGPPAGEPPGPPGRRGPPGPDPGPGRAHLRHLGPGEPLRVPLRRPLAKPRPDRAARAAPRGLRPGPEPGARLLRGPVHRRADGDPQRRRQPARALPRRGRQRPAPGGHHRGPGGRRLLHPGPEHRLAGVPPDPGDPLGVVPVPAAHRPALRRGPRPGRGPLGPPRREPRGHRHHQELHHRGPGGGAPRRRLGPLPGRQPRRHPPLLGLQPPHPRGDPGRLHRHPGLRRLRGPRRDAGRGRLQRHGLPHPAPALAADPPGADLRPLPAGHGLHHPDPRPGGHRAGHRLRGLAPAGGRGARRGALRRPLLRLPPGRAGPRPPRPRGPRRGDGGGGRGHRLREDHPGQAPPALLRGVRRADHRRRPRRRGTSTSATSAARSAW